MDKRYDPLFTPWKIGNVEIKNRFVLCPMEGTNIIEWQTKTCFNENIWQFYRDRAKNDIGLMIPGAVPVRSIVGNKWLYKHPKVFNEVREFMGEMHSYDSKVFMQLTLGPGRSMPLPKIFQGILDKKWLCTLLKPFMGIDAWMVAPDTDSPNVWNPNYKHRALTKKEIQDYIYAMGQTAKLCKEAGVDGVEIHAMHEGYLIDQFTMPYTNHRNDEYGGSFEGRMLLPAAIVKEIKKVCGDDYPVSLRYSVTSKTKGFNQGAVPGEEFKEAGRTMEESKKAIAYLREAGYDMFNCDNGTYDAWYWPHPPVYAPLNTNLKESIEIKPYAHASIVCAGRMQPEEAADAIAAGQIDAMGIGRQFLCDGETVTKIKEGRMEDIRPCISCHAACLPLGRHNYEGCEFDIMHIIMGRCVLNPYTLEEKNYSLKPAKTPKKIAVVGGGLGGMEVAIQAMKRGHKVDLYEKTDQLGGVFNAAATPEFKEKDRDLLAWYRRQLERSGASVHRNTEIKDISKLNADEIVIATGSTKARTLNCPGGKRAIPAVDYLNHKKEVGDKVVVIGGALTGCEIAYELALEGKHPVIVEMLNDLICTPGVSMANSQMLRDLLAYYKVPVYLESSARAIKEKSVVIKTKEGIREVDADSVIASVGYISGAPLAEEQSSEHVHVIGDAKKIGNLKTVIKEAYDLVQEFSY